MVRVPGGPYSIGVAAPVTLPDYWIDTARSPTREFKRFVDAGGYRDASTGRNRSSTATARSRSTRRLRDSAMPPAGRGRPRGSWAVSPRATRTSPSAGSAGSKRRPTRSSPARACRRSITGIARRGVDDVFSRHPAAQQLRRQGPGASRRACGLGPWARSTWRATSRNGARTPAQGRTRRYILGGGWNEPSYRYTEADAQDPWERRPTFGVRLDEEPRARQ